jgi:FK506-binding protein 2
MGDVRETACGSKLPLSPLIHSQHPSPGTMLKLALFLIVALALAATASADITGGVTKLQIGVKHRPDECTVKSKPGDSLSVHCTYWLGGHLSSATAVCKSTDLCLVCLFACLDTGTLIDGTKFDSSVDRNSPFTFTLGKGQVIKGWDHGMTNMCVGEKRKLKIPSDMGYGASGSPPKIPGKFTGSPHTPQRHSFR